MKVAIFIISSIIVFLYIGHFSLTIKPFSVSYPFWHRSVGLLIIIIGFIIFNVGEHVSGYTRGLKDGADNTIEIIKQHARDNK